MKGVKKPDYLLVAGEPLPSETSILEKTTGLMFLGIPTPLN